MMEDHQLISSQRHLRVRSAFIVTKLDFVGLGAEVFHDSTHLATNQSLQVRL